MGGEWTRVTNKRVLGCYLLLTGDIAQLYEGWTENRKAMEGSRNTASWTERGIESIPALKVVTRVRHTGTRGETAKYSDNYIVELLTGMIVTRDTRHFAHLYFRAVQNF